MDVYDLATEMIHIVYSTDYNDQRKIELIKELIDKYVNTRK